MSLLDELKEKRQDAIENFETQGADIEVTREQLADQQRVRAFWAAQIVDLDKAISALTPEGKEALLDDQPEPVPTEVRKQDEQDAAVKPYRVYVENSVRGEATSLGFDTSVFALDYAQRMSASGAVTRVHVVEGMSAPNSETIFLWEVPPPAQEAPAIPEGFIPWHGGECPVGDNVKVEAIDRGGSRYISDDGIATSLNLDWRHGGSLNDIIAYRIIEAADIGAALSGLDSQGIQQDATEQTEHDRPKLTNEEFESLEKIDGVLDAEPSPILRSEVPPAAETYLAPSGDEFATVNGQTHLIVSDEAEAQGQAETAPQAAYAPIHNEDEPAAVHPDAAFWAKALPAEAEAKAEEQKFNPFRLFGGAKKTLVGEGV